jgi:hypothetical protein
MHVKRVQFSLPSKDLKGSLQYYTEGLLFTEVFDFKEYCTVALDQFWLSFVPSDGVRMPVRESTSGCLFSVELDDIHSYYERVRATGRVRFKQELEIMQPGVWQFSVVDNNGYFLGFSMPNRAT